MGGERKLQALGKTYELQEQQAVGRKLNVDAVVEERQRATVKLLERRNTLLNTLSSLRKKDKRSAVLSGEAWRLNSISYYEKKVQEQILALESMIEEKTKELQRACARQQMAEKEIVEARIERKKLENFLDRQKTYQRISEAAREEIVSDEMSGRKKRQ